MKTKGDHAGKICVVVGTVTDDLRLYEVPPLKVRLFAIFSVRGSRFSYINTLEFDVADIFSGHLNAQVLVLFGEFYLQYHCFLIASMPGFHPLAIENKSEIFDKLSQESGM